MRSAPTVGAPAPPPKAVAGLRPWRPVESSCFSLSLCATHRNCLTNSTSYFPPSAVVLLTVPFSAAGTPRVSSRPRVPCATRPCGPRPHRPSLARAPQKLYILGGEIAESAQKCTHLVASKVTRTVKFLTAISVVKHVVTPEWLDECFKCQAFVGEWPRPRLRV